MNWFVLVIVPLLAQAVEATPTPGSTQATLLQLLKSGGWVMWPLILTSVIMLSLIFACLFSLAARNGGDPPIYGNGRGAPAKARLPRD